MNPDFKSNRKAKKQIVNAIEKLERRTEKQQLYQKPSYIRQTALLAIQYLHAKYLEIPHVRSTDFDFRIERNRNSDTSEYKVTFRIGSGSKGKRFSKYVGIEPFVLPVLIRMKAEQEAIGQGPFTQHALEDIKRLSEGKGKM
jgi:hypothetical protein